MAQTLNSKLEIRNCLAFSTSMLVLDHKGGSDA